MTFKGILIISVFSFLFMLSLASAATNKTCTSNYTMMLNSTYSINVNGTVTPVNVSKEVPCPYGCSNNECIGINPEADLSTMWLVWATGTALLSISVILGLPFGRMISGGRSPMGGFNTTLILKYLFFFIGFMFVYFAFGMARGIAGTYGGSSSTISAADTATMVSLITLVLFLFVFIVEFIFSLTNWLAGWSTRRRAKKYEGRRL